MTLWSILHRIPIVGPLYMLWCSHKNYSKTMAFIGEGIENGTIIVQDETSPSVPSKGEDA